MLKRTVHEPRCPPDVKHWHGAAPGTAMTHLAITGTLDGKNVNWLEKVTDEEYGAAHAEASALFRAESLTRRSCCNTEKGRTAARDWMA